MRRRPGFTLIELLIVTVLVGILASIAVVKYRAMEVKAYATAVQVDLRVLSQHQELYYTVHQRYGATEALIEFTPSPNVDVTIASSSVSGWSGTAAHSALPGYLCALFIGDAAALPPATHRGHIECNSVP